MPRWLSVSLAVLIAVFIAAVLVAPLGPIPGIRLGGTEMKPPADWSSLDLPETVQLETKAGLLPRVVNIWIVRYDNALWVLGNPESGWVRQASTRGDVRLRIGDRVYRLRAKRITEPAAYRAYIERYRDGYPDLIATLPPPEAAASIAIFRLDRL